MCTVIICCPVCDVKNFEVNRSFFIKLFFYITEKSKQKCRYLKNEKGTWNEKHFSSFWMDFQLSEIVSDMRLGL